MICSGCTFLDCYRMFSPLFLLFLNSLCFAILWSLEITHPHCPCRFWRLYCVPRRTRKTASTGIGITGGWAGWRSFWRWSISLWASILDRKRRDWKWVILSCWLSSWWPSQFWRRSTGCGGTGTQEPETDGTGLQLTESFSWPITIEPLGQARGFETDDMCVLATRQWTQADFFCSCVHVSCTLWWFPMLWYFIWGLLYTTVIDIGAPSSWNLTSLWLILDKNLKHRENIGRSW